MEKNEASKLKALADIAAIDITLDFNEILREILKIACEAMNAHSGTMMLVEESNELRVVASYGLPPDYIEKVYEAANKAGVTITSSPSGTVLKTGKYYAVPDAFKEPKNKPWYYIAKEAGFSAMIFSPMKRGTKVIGLLNVYMAEPHQFTEEEINFAAIAASQASSVVQNAGMCVRLKNNIQELQQYKVHLEDKIKETHKKLFDSEARFRDLFENADDPMYTLDACGYFQTINKAGLLELGGTADEIIGSHISGWLTPESLKISQEILQKQIAGEVWNEPVILEVISRNGEHKWGEIRTRVIKDGDRITGVHGIARDITEKRGLEEKLKESEARYRDLFENADDPMYTLDTEGCFKTINNAGLKVLGGTMDNVIGSHISGWLTPQSFKDAKERLIRHFSGASVEEPVVYELIRKNGEHRWAEVRTRPVKDGEKITGIHGIARDVTEKVRLEQELKEYHQKLERSYEELKEADRLKTEFISNITHELLTPMTSIKGFTELICDETMGEINDEQRKSTEIILRNSDRLIRLIKELLDGANIEKNRLGLQFRLVSISDILMKSIQDMHPQARDKEIMIIENIEPLPEIWGDEERLTQAITNLLVNAIKFTQRKGKITLTAYEDATDVRISITDTGIGIPADKLTRIFDRFYQADGSTRRKYGGVGLGLSICKGIIEKHYGSIWAESDGRGSTFHVILPKLDRARKHD